ncbi:MAG: TonB-dependent receptor [Pseudomonadota bacterium]
MHHPLHQRTLVSLAVASACAMLGGQAYAQQTPAPLEEVQTVTVTGFRTSLQKSIDLKRAAIVTRDSIVAEDIGKFPEQNIADALVRLPGVEVEKDGASNEGQRIRLRGLGAEYTVTTFNGAPVRATSAGAIGVASREFNYDIFPSELFGRVDVYKSPLAELEEGGVAGAVDLQSPRPFDKKGRVIRYSGAMTNNSKSGSNDPRAHVLLSNTWGNWGVLVSAAASKANNANAGFQSTGTYNSFNQRFTAGNFPFTWNLQDPRANLNGMSLSQLHDGILPRFIRITSTDTKRERIGFTTSVQYKTNALDVSWDTLASNLKDDLKNNYLNFPINGSTQALALIPLNLRVDANNNLQGTMGNVRMSTNALTGLTETDFKYNALNAKYKLTDKLRLTGQLAVNSSFAWRNSATTTAEAFDADKRHDLTLDTSDPLFPNLSSNRDLLDRNLYTNFVYSGQYLTEKDKQKIIKLAADYDYGFWDVEGRVKVGLSQVESGKQARGFASGNLLNGLTIPGVGLFGSATAAQKAAFGQTQLVPNDQNNIHVGGNVPQSWMTFNRPFIYETLDALNQNRNAPANLGGTFDAVETISALYLQTDLEKKVFNRSLRTNFGVRYVETKSDVDNYVLVAGAHVPTNRKSKYTNTLPSATFAYDLTEDLVWRGSWGKTIKRSSISAIARSFNVANGGDLIITAGNPGLMPEASTNLDTSLEWYFEKGALLGLSLYKKDIKGRPVTMSAMVPFSALGLPKELFTANNQTVLTNDPDTPVELRQVRNGEDFTIKGIELAYQQTYKTLPWIFKHMGSIVSVTKVQTAGTTRIYDTLSYDVPIIPENTYALTLYYENGPLSLRTSYNHKSGFADFNNNVTNPLGYQRWNNKRGYLDASVGYKINDYVEVRLDGANLTNTKTYQYLDHFQGRNGDPESRIENGNQAGRNITLSLRGKF